jgi:hypothetical protein
VLSWLAAEIFTLLGIGLLLLIIVSVLSPLESLGWWAGWSKGSHSPSKRADLEQKSRRLRPKELKDYYLVYLSGIGMAGTDKLAPDEQDFIQGLQAAMPEAEVIIDVFPYSVTNNPLTGERALASLWKKVREMQLQNPNHPLALLSINIRNAMQVLVSSDPRYGPIYSLGVAEEIARSLARHGYPIGSRKPVFLIGYSGGGQVSVGAAPYLKQIIETPVYIVTVGGFLTDDPGIRFVEHLRHLYGDKDPLQAVAAYLWFGRWPVMVQSAWNQALHNGKISLQSTGPMAHNGKGGYYDAHSALEDGQSFCDATAQAVSQAIRSLQLSHPTQFMAVKL